MSICWNAEHCHIGASAELSVNLVNRLQTDNVNVFVKCEELELLSQATSHLTNTLTLSVHERDRLNMPIGY